MADETKNCSKVSLTSSKKTLSSILFTLKVPNFFALPEYNDAFFDIRSPTFEFANATWCFRFDGRKTEGKEAGDIIKKFDIDIIRLNSKFPENPILSNIALLDANGEKYDSYSTSCLVDEVNCFYTLQNFDNSISYDDGCDILTLVIHLVSGASLEEEEEPIKTSRDVETLSQDFKKLFLNGKKQDLTLRVADKEFRVHQDILMARSPVFEAMLTHDMTEKNKGVIDVPDCNPQAMEQFLLYVYSGKVDTLSQENVLGLYYAADKYQMMPLKEECAEFIKKSLSPLLICDVVQLALNHSDTDLLECATEYFVNNASEILPTVEWISFMKSNTTTANELFVKYTKKFHGKKS